MGLLKNVGAGFGFPEALPETRYGAFFNSAIFVFTENVRISPKGNAVCIENPPSLPVRQRKQRRKA